MKEQEAAERLGNMRFFAGKENAKAFKVAIHALEEIQQYRSIGTVEECKEARERQRAKKPNKRADRYTDLIQHYSCPVCGRYFGQAGVHNVIQFDKPKYCTCGQAIDWEGAAVNDKTENNARNYSGIHH